MVWSWLVSLIQSWIVQTLQFIKQSDNDKNSNQEAKVQYHAWRLLLDAKEKEQELLFSPPPVSLVNQSMPTL